MPDKLSIFTIAIFLISFVVLIFILNSNYIPSFVLGYGVPISIFSGFALLAFVFSVKKGQ